MRRCVYGPSFGKSDEFCESDGTERGNEDDGGKFAGGMGGGGIEFTRVGAEEKDVVVVSTDGLEA